MNFKKIVSQLIITIPISLLAFLFSDSIEGNIMGGIGTSVGFPFTYYHCVFMPELTNGNYINYNRPFVLVLDILLFILITAIIYSSFSDKEFDIKKLSKISLFEIGVFNIFVLYIFIQYITPVLVRGC